MKINKQLTILSMIIVMSMILISSIDGATTQATCVASLADAFITCGSNCTFESGSLLSGIEIGFKANKFNFDYPHNQMIVQLLDKDNKTITGSTKVVIGLDNSKNLYKIDCPNTNCDTLKYKLVKGDYILRATIDPTTKDNPTGLNLIVQSKIKVMLGLDIRLTCNTETSGIAYVNRESSCTWKVYQTNATTPTLITVSAPKFEVFDSDGLVVDNNNGKFTPTKEGAYSLVMTVNVPGYVTTTETVTISVKDTQINHDLIVDSKDYSEYDGGVFKTGIRTIVLKFDESGKPVDVLNVDMKMRTPSGQDIPLVFTKSGDSWKSQFNFEQEAQTYTMSGVVQFVDEGLGDKEISYPFVTSSKYVDTTTGSYTWIIAGVAFFIVLIIIVVAIFMWPRKGRR